MRACQRVFPGGGNFFCQRPNCSIHAPNALGIERCPLSICRMLVSDIPAQRDSERTGKCIFSRIPRRRSGVIKSPGLWLFQIGSSVRTLPKATRRSRIKPHLGGFLFVIHLSIVKETVGTDKMTNFRESQHPREEHGRFVAKKRVSRFLLGVIAMMAGAAVTAIIVWLFGL